MTRNEEMIWTHEGGELKIPDAPYKTKTFKMLLTDNGHVIDEKIRCFGKWKSSSSSCCTKGVIYLVIGDGDFDGTVKFINDSGHVDEASVSKFDLATNGQYTAQFKKLEEKEVPETKAANAPTSKPKKKKK